MEDGNTPALHQNDALEVPELPPLPNHLDLPDLPQTQEWLDASPPIDDDADAHHLTGKEGSTFPDAENETNVNGRKRNRISFMNKCIRAQKSLFLHDNRPDNLWNKIPDDVFLDGIIISVPRQVKSNSYRIIWDTSSLHIPIGEGDLRSTVMKGEEDKIQQLKLARSKFDTTYPNGPPPGILSIKHRSRKANNAGKKKQANSSKRKKNASKKKQTIRQSNETDVLHKDIQTMELNSANRSVTNLRMAPVLTEMVFNNQHPMVTQNHIENEDDSDPDDELFAFQDDDDDEYDNVVGHTLNQQDLLHGYVPDDGYNPSGMEEDGVYPEALSWTYGEVPQDGINENYYHYSRRPSLRHNICNKFETILGSCSVA
jgi:hypothetical protein